MRYVLTSVVKGFLCLTIMGFAFLIFMFAILQHPALVIVAPGILVMAWDLYSKLAGVLDE